MWPHGSSRGRTALYSHVLHALGVLKQHGSIQHLYSSGEQLSLRDQQRVQRDAALRHVRYERSLPAKQGPAMAVNPLLVSAQQAMAARWDRLEPVQQGRLYDIIFNMNRTGKEAHGARWRDPEGASYWAAR
jgi:hypothetical protein